MNFFYFLFLKNDIECKNYKDVCKVLGFYFKFGNVWFDLFLNDGLKYCFWYYLYCYYMQFRNKDKLIFYCMNNLMDFKVV